MLLKAIFVLSFLAPTLSLAAVELPCETPAPAKFDPIVLRPYKGEDVELFKRIEAEYPKVAKKEYVYFDVIARVTGRNNHEKYVGCIAPLDIPIREALTQYVNSYLPYTSPPKLTHRIYEGRDVILKTGEKIHLEPIKLGFQKIVGLETAGTATERLRGIRGDYDASTQAINFIFDLRYTLAMEVYELEIYMSRETKFYLDSDLTKPFRSNP